MGDRARARRPAARTLTVLHVLAVACFWPYLRSYCTVFLRFPGVHLKFNRLGATLRLHLFFKHFILGLSAGLVWSPVTFCLAELLAGGCDLLPNPCWLSGP